MRAERVAIALAVILLPGVLLMPVWPLAGLGANEDDILYYYPSRVFFHETITAGRWPWLNPWNGLDRPYAADPQSALWYPFTWLFAALPPLWAYPLSLWAHYGLALWGTYRLLRAVPVDRRAALLGGVAFAFCGFMLAHRAHFSMQHAAAWTPWVFWRLQRYVLHAQRAGGERSGAVMLRLGTVCVCAALQCFAGHVQIAALTALGSLVFLLARGRGATPNTTKKAIVTRWLVAWICVAGLFAVQWLPTMAYVPLCTRVDHTYRDFVENSWYPSSVIGWLFPMFFGQRTDNFFGQSYWGPSHQCEQFSYAGLVPLLLAALALRGGWRSDPGRRAWVVLLIFGLLLALGGFGPICPLLYWIPGSNLFRVPARGLLLVNLAIAVLAALALHELGAAHTPRRVRLRATVQGWTRRPLLATLALIVIPLCLAALTLPLLPGATRQAALSALRPWSAAVVVPLLIALASLAALAVAAKRWRQPGWLWLPVIVTALDLGIIGWTIDVPADARRPADLVSGRVQDWLKPIRDSGQRLWVATDTAGVYADPVSRRAANTNALAHIPALADYGPLQPRTLHALFAFTPWGVSRRTEELLQDTSWMRAFNVGWILLCERDAPSPTGCDPVTSASAGWPLYRNPTAAGMAFFEQPTQPGAVYYVEQSPSKFVTTIDTWPTKAAPDGSPGLSETATWPRVIVSRLALPGWRAVTDEQAVPIETAHQALLALRVPPGRAAQVTWTYFPPGLREGAVVSVLSAAVLLLLATLTRRRRALSERRTASPAPLVPDSQP